MWRRPGICSKKKIDLIMPSLFSILTYLLILHSSNIDWYIWGLEIIFEVNCFWDGRFRIQSSFSSHAEVYVSLCQVALEYGRIIIWYRLPPNGLYRFLNWEVQRLTMTFPLLYLTSLLIIKWHILIIKIMKKIISEELSSHKKVESWH